jgi:hypothetical protein
MGSPHVWLKAVIEDATGSGSGYEVTAWPVEMTGAGDPPYVIYQRTSTVRELMLPDALDDAPEIDSLPPVATFTVTVYADSYVEAWEIADAVTLAVHKFSGSAHGETIQTAIVTDVADGDSGFLEGREQPTFTVELTVEITYQE